MIKTIPTLLSFTLLSGVAQALTIIQTKSFSFTPAGNQTLTFDKSGQDPGNWKLDSVTVTTSLTKSGGSLYVDNDSAVAASGSISQSITISLSSTGPILINTSYGAIGNETATTSYFVALAADDGDGEGYQAGGPDWGGTTFSDRTVAKTETVAAFALDSYKGEGSTFSITVSGGQNIDTAAVSGVAGSFTPSTASGDVTVTYQYSSIGEVPEPEPWLMVCLSLGGTMFYRRRSY